MLKKNTKQFEYIFKTYAGNIYVFNANYLHNFYCLFQQLKNIISIILVDSFYVKCVWIEIIFIKKIV